MRGAVSSFRGIAATESLFDLLATLDGFPRGSAPPPLAIYAEGGSDAGRGSRALVFPRPEDGSPTCPLDPALSEVLSVEQAREAVAVWSAWRGGVAPSPEERFRAVMFYAQCGAFLPLETDREGM